MKKTVSIFCFSALLLSGCTAYHGDISGSTAFYSSPAPEAAMAQRKMMKGGLNVSNSAAYDAAAEGSAYFQQNNSRMMAYTAGFTLTVKQREKALDELKKLAESFGGYLVSSARGVLTVKIPVAKADEFMKKSGDYGKMSDFRISAEDLTDTITDLDVRLENLRKLRTRLTELLAKAKNVDEMLKVERELNRVTTEIERMSARLQNNKDRVATVTFTIGVVEEHGAIPGGTPQAIDKFEFLNELSSNEGGIEDEPLFDIGIPAGFVGFMDYSGRDYGFTATSDDDCIFRTWERNIPDDSTLEFWQKMVCRALAHYDGYENIKCVPAELDGKKAVKITAQATTARGIQHYMAVISIDRGVLFSDQLQIVEFFGPADAFAKHEKAVTSAIR